MRLGVDELVKQCPADGVETMGWERDGDATLGRSVRCNILSFQPAGPREKGLGWVGG